MSERNRVLLLILIMAATTLIVAGMTIYVLYAVALDEQRERLVETAQSQARLIEAVARFDATYNKDYPEGSAAASLTQIIDAHEHYEGFGETGEFTLARLVGDNMVFLLSHRHYDLENPKPVPFDSELAEPMRRALTGLSGTVVGRDYRGERVLAAYEPVAELNLGIVAKIDLAEIRQPFVRAGGLAIGLALLVVSSGVALFFRISNPIIRRLKEHAVELAKANAQLRREIGDRKQIEEALRESEERYRSMMEAMIEPVYICSPDFRVTYMNPAMINRIGYDATGEFCYEAINGLRERCPFCVYDQIQHGGHLMTEIVSPKDGRSYLVSHSPIFHVDGMISKMTIYRDVTDHKRTEHALRKAHEELEKRVGERTAELSKSNALLKQEIAERKRVEETLRLSESRLAALVKLSQKTETSTKEIADFVLEEGVKLTKSEIGFLGFMDDAETTLILHSWSKDAMAQCSIIDRPMHFPTENAGLWGDAVRKRKPIIVNDYSLPNPQKKGYPEGHVPLSRLICVPAFDKGRIVAVAGMANKEKDYDTSDVHQLILLMDGMWRIIERKRAEEALRESEQRYRALFESAPVGIALTSLDGHVFASNDAMLQMTGYSREDLEQISAENTYCNPEEHGLLMKRLQTEGYVRDLEARLKRKDGTHFDAGLTLSKLVLGAQDVILTVAEDITERKRAEQALQRSEAELRRLSSQLIRAQEEERRRIALELHDGIGQSLSAIKYRVEVALGEIGQDGSARFAGSLEPIVPAVQEAVEEARRIQRNLRPPTLDDLGILATVSWFCREFETTYSGIRIEKRIDVDEKDVPDSLKIVVFRILQEALNNAAKHSAANRVILSLKRKDGDIELTINDNGMGFVVEDVLSGEQSGRGFGLSSMRERTELSGGFFAIESAPGEGSTVRASWPYYAE